ncbi:MULTISPECIES: RNA polymerase-binding protein DksA [Pectobacterium]|uniref:RNA polymerase-binding transcription factor DksA n=2 Tax=Pectobacterium TaxID=122277 RepID=A0AAI9L547_PECCC|nr:MULTISPECIES: RNA polymerase-binding protein DksA [Pectobacterium]AVT59394.1 RNA polymerase-binding transcription factor [Pectobacterium versatile]KHT32815.1 molecular chaperone DnaK [Pectobacterium carotovorum subsp. carotovorum]MCA6937645.1 RNA polymerase-binding protein DksA [Pectobacterium versatile]MCQ8231559.1 RNA polymerase-binding protein DksA [Pectobacterium carotovorum]PVY71299.1 TraR/DksA family transcriptional regulator [Pectobacterium versatile]
MPSRIPKEEVRILAMPEVDYMNSAQLAFFTQRLQTERLTLLQHIEELKGGIQRSEQSGDEGDKAMREEELRMLFRQIDRESRLLPKIDAALQRIRSGEYGYCLETGEPIGLRRLLLRPTAELSIDAKQTQEIKEHQRRRH